MKIGAICSAGGATFFAAVDILLKCGTSAPGDFLLVTDRECGAEVSAQSRGIRCRRITEKSNTKFSIHAEEAFSDFNSDLIFLFFSRIVTADLYDKHTVLNVHPSLLPAFRGFGALAAARNAGVQLFGSTLHVADGQVDAGRIVCQVVSSLNFYDSDKKVEKISFLQKVYLVLTAIDLVKNNLIAPIFQSSSSGYDKKLRSSWSANPALISQCYIQAFQDLQDQAGLDAIFP